jgi:hypothetical protein
MLMFDLLFDLQHTEMDLPVVLVPMIRRGAIHDCR